MKLSTCASLLALSALVVLIEVTPAAADAASSSDPNMPIGKYISYYDKVKPALQNPPTADFTSLNVRKLLTQQAAQAVQSSTAVQSAQAVQTAAAAASTEGVKSADKTDKANKEQHHGDYYGGAVSQPPPGAPVYYPPTYSQHGDHYDYIPGHYHYGRKLLAQGQQLLAQGRMLQATQESNPTQAASKEAAVQKLLAKGNALVNHGRMLMAAEAAKSAQTANKQAAVQSSEGAQGAKKVKTVEKAAHWGGSGHYDYYGASYAPHGDHYDYVPAHYHYHEGNHWHRKMMSAQQTESAQAAASQNAAQHTASAATVATAAKAKAVKNAEHDGWEGNGHYDYYGPSYTPHGDHYDYVPAHYHYHEGEHGFEGNDWDHDDDSHKRL